MIKSPFFQKDKGGKRYIYHPIYLSLKVNGYKEKIVALLHDVIEDSDYTLEDLNVYFDKDVIEAVKVITKVKGEKYMEYLERVKNNNIAKK